MLLNNLYLDILFQFYPLEKEYNLCFIYKMNPEFQEEANRAQEEAAERERLAREAAEKAAGIGGRRHRGSKKAHKGKRHGNASLRAWVTFVKKVQKEEGIGYKEAMSVAKKRKDSGEKWRGGAFNSETGLDDEKEQEQEQEGGRRRRRRTQRRSRSHKRSRRHRRSRRHH